MKRRRPVEVAVIRSQLFGSSAPAAIKGSGPPRAPEASMRAPMPRDDPSQLSIVVVTHDSAEALAGSLPALCRQLAPGDELIVVDNASADATLSVVAELAPAAVVLETGRNAGFAAG